MPHLLQTLKFQISLALAVLVLMFGISITVSQLALESQARGRTVVEMGGRLQYSARQMAMQAMNYRDNAPRDYETYHRDLNLYYQDLMSHMETFDMIEESFMTQKFTHEVTGMDEMMEPELDPEALEAVHQLHDTWKAWREPLLESLGPKHEEPRLEWAANYISDNSKVLQEATDLLLSHLERFSREQNVHTRTLNHTVLGLGLVLTLGILLWFYRRVLNPLGAMVQGMREVALGDFDYRLPVTANNEIGWLSRSFNDLSQQLHSIFRLITRLQQGSDLDDTLRFVAEEFVRLVPLDWVGVLLVTGEDMIQLEKGYADGHSEATGAIRFPLTGTLLEQALQSGEPLRVDNIGETAKTNPAYRFLELLDHEGYRDAIFLPITSQSPMPGVLVFASRQAHAYQQEHMDLLSNIALLITHSFGRTVKLVEHQRLATVGQFASGIAHEIRSPLSTISLALEYFRDTDLPGPAAKRAELAYRESERLNRLLEDMLLYAKPLVLHTEALDIRGLLEETLETHRGIAEEKSQRVEVLAVSALPTVEGDRDRLIQVILNLTKNACQAAPEGSSIVWTLTRDPRRGWLEMEIQNAGPPIPTELRKNLFDPFVTGRSQGTGLGLSIVKRILDIHGGEIQLHSDARLGTRVSLCLPPASGERSAESA